MTTTNGGRRKQMAIHQLSRQMALLTTSSSTVSNTFTVATRGSNNPCAQSFPYRNTKNQLSGR